MSEDREALARERVELDRRYREYIATHGFNYREFVDPSPGSFIDLYKRRTAEIDAVLAPELKGPGEEPDTDT